MTKKQWIVSVIVILLMMVEILMVRVIDLQKEMKHQEQYYNVAMHELEKKYDDTMDRLLYFKEQAERK